MAVTAIDGGKQIRDNTVTASKVASSVIVAAGTNAFTGDQSVGGNKLTSVGTPVSGTDAANKNYVDAMATGLDFKASVRAATTAALPAATYANGSSGVGATLTANANGALAAQDGVTLVAGDRLLVKNQATGAQNGIYTVTQVGDASNPFILTRATDADTATELNAGAFAFVEEGTTNADVGFVCTTNNPVTIGTTALSFTQFSSAGSYTQGNGIAITGQSIAVSLGDASLEFSGGSVRVVHGTSGQIYVASAGGVLTPVTASGDVSSITAAGAVTLDVTKIPKFSRYSVRETPTGTINGSNAAFVLANTPISGTEQVYLNGIQQDSGASNDYTISTATITFNTAPVSGDKVRVTYWY